MKTTYVTIGDITHVHGINGYVAIRLIESIHSLQGVTFIFIKMGHTFVPYQVEKAKLTNQQALIKLQGIDNCMDASELVGKTTWLPNDQIATLIKDDITDEEPTVIGYQVTDIHEGPLGIVQRIERFPMHCCLVTAYHGAELLIPYHAALIQHLDHAKQQLVLNLPRGFIAALGHQRV